jgi:hypothetical protein
MSLSLLPFKKFDKMSEGNHKRYKQKARENESGNFLFLLMVGKEFGPLPDENK